MEFSTEDIVSDFPLDVQEELQTQGDSGVSSMVIKEKMRSKNQQLNDVLKQVEITLTYETPEINKAFYFCQIMFENRGYYVTTYDLDLKFLIAQKALITNQVAGLSEKIYIFFSLQPKLAVKEFEAFITRATNEAVKMCIVYNDSITPSVKKIIELQSIEIFSVKSLQYDITKHVLVPQHIKLTQTEIQELKLNKYKLPVLSVSDPVSRYYNYSKGDIIQIIRKGQVEHSSQLAYRIVK
jgi:DNA-directed RNA polymerase subunit H (RpoH/RPB5)